MEMLEVEVVDEVASPPGHRKVVRIRFGGLLVEVVVAVDCEMECVEIPEERL